MRCVDATSDPGVDTRLAARAGAGGVCAASGGAGNLRRTGGPAQPLAGGAHHRGAALPHPVLHSDWLRRRHDS
eukprot:554297-Pyramimonas_sp.AAC.1